MHDLITPVICFLPYLFPICLLFYIRILNCMYKVLSAVDALVYLTFCSIEYEDDDMAVDDQDIQKLVIVTQVLHGTFYIFPSTLCW